MIEELFKEIKDTGILDAFNPSGFIETLKQMVFSKQVVYKKWLVPLDDFEFSTSDFYQMIEKELAVRKVPGLEITRVEFSEGGPALRQTPISSAAA